MALWWSAPLKIESVSPETLCCVHEDTSSPLFTYMTENCWVDSKQTKLDFTRWYTIANTHFLSNQSICKVWSCYVQWLGGDAFTRKYIISPLTLMLVQGQTWNVAHYPLHHMTYAPAKFEVGMSNGLGENSFFDLDLAHSRCCPVPSSCDLCTYRFWTYYI